MSWKRKRSELVRQVRRTIKWCRTQRAPKGGENRLREAERLFREALNCVEETQAKHNLTSAMGLLAEHVDSLR